MLPVLKPVCPTILNGEYEVKFGRLRPGVSARLRGVRVALFSLALGFFTCLTVEVPAADAAGPIRILFLGDKGHHQPRARFEQLQPVLGARGIEIEYTENTANLKAEKLAGFAGLALYANIDSIPPDAEKALLDFVAGGKGFIPLHCASYCFRNSESVVALMGAQFQRHGTGTFRTTIVGVAHPIMNGFHGFESWDETYVHTKHNEKDRIVLEVREDAEGKEPWTWVRTHGKGRVFYTAWGHDERTWGHPGFQNLVERGIRWAIGGDPGAVRSYSDRPEMTAKRTDVKPFEFVEAKVPFYPAGTRWGVTGDPFTKMQKPLDVEESMKHFVTPLGFEVRLFAKEPEIGGKPICMSWDEGGRLWIAETIDYPNEKQPEGEGRDRIRILEDADGDGRADRFTVFAEKLSLPTSIAFAQGGAIVHQPPETLFLKDTNGDGAADERRVLFSGWSLADTHAGPSNLNWGLDNWLYGICGYSGFRGNVGGENVSFQTGFYRLKPDGSKLEFLRNTNNNSWGVGFSEEGVLFGSTANANPSEYMPIPNRYYESVKGWSSSVLRGIAGNPKFDPITEQVRQVDQHGRFTAAAGHALYTARAYPREYWNRIAFVCEPTGHLVARFELEPQGAGYASRIAGNLLASDDEWSAPIMAEVGPDGHVWVIDWYNFIVQHNPTPAGFRTGKGAAYETELRDKKHGRIYRIVYKGAPAAPKISLKDATPRKLVETLKSDNLLWRRHAQRLLVERRKKDVVPDLLKLVEDKSVDEIGLNAGAIHALWTLHGLGALDGSVREATEAAVAALAHRSAGVRRTALQVVPPSAESAARIIEEGLLADRDGQVRLTASLALAELPNAPGGGAATFSALAREANAADRWLIDGLTSAAAASAGNFLRSAVAVTDGGGRETQAVASQLSPVLRIVAEHHARGAPPGAAGDLVGILRKAAPAVAEAVVTGLSRGWPKDKPVTLNEESEKNLLALFEKLPAGARGVLVSLAARWGAKSLEKHSAEIAVGFLATVRDEKGFDSDRIAAAGRLIEFRPQDAEAARGILAVISARTSPELAVAIVDAAGKSAAPETAAALLESFPSFTPTTRAAAVRALLSRPEWTEPLLAAFEDGSVPVGELSLDQKQSLASHPDKTLAERARAILEKGGSLPNADRQKVIEELSPLVLKKADPGAGKEVFKKICAKCHTHSGEGAKVGPDLTGMAVHPKEELLINILDPNRSVEGNYRMYTAITKDGRVLNGLMASESRTAVEIYDVEGQKHALQREDLRQIVASTLSLMPDGFEKQAPAEDLANLLEFLTQRGKYLPLPLDKVATVVSTRGMFLSEDSQGGDRLVFSDWTPKTFEGVPFYLVDPQGGRARNAILLYGPQGGVPPRMPKSVTVPCRSPVKAIHLLSGVSGWGFPLGEKGSVTMIVRLHYADGKAEDHALKNGEHFADYIRRVDVPGSKFAFRLRGQQLRYLTVHPQRQEQPIERIEFVKGPDATAPVVMAVTVEGA